METNPFLLVIPKRLTPPTQLERIFSFIVLGFAFWTLTWKESEFEEKSNPGPRTIVNVDEVDQYIRTFRGALPEPVRHWMQKNLRNYLLRDYDGLLPYLPEYLERASEKWVKERPWLPQALERGEKVYQIDITNELTRDIMHILDYFTSPEGPTNLTGISFPEALRQANVWLQKLMKKGVNKKDASRGEVLIKTYDDGYSWKRLDSDAALDLEGKRMGHCIGSYAEKVRLGESVNYSLRDSKDEPHVTLEVSPRYNEIIQIQGKQNQLPVKKYWPYVRDFLKTTLHKVTVPDDLLRRIGLYKIGKRYVDVEELKQDKALVYQLISPRIYKDNLPLITEKMELMDDGVAITNLYLDELFTIMNQFDVYLGNYFTVKKLREELERYHDIDQRIQHHGYEIESLIDSLEKQHPKTYKKIRQYINILESKTNRDYRRENAGEWFYDVILHSKGLLLTPDTVTKHAHHQLHNVLDALYQAIGDGYHVGTQSAAYRYVGNLVDDLHFSDRSYTYRESKNKDLFGIVLDWGSLLNGDNTYLDDSDKEKLDYEYRHGRGYEYEYDEDAAKERFYEALAETSFKLPD